MSATMDRYAILRPLAQKPWLYAELGGLVSSGRNIPPEKFQTQTEQLETDGHITVTSGTDKPYGRFGSRIVSITDSGRAILENPSAPTATSALVGGGSKPVPA